ncbi:TOBE domain protein [compost metagenome]
MAIRPEVLDLTASDGGVAVVHRVTDYGTHGLVDLDLSDGTRLKSMVAHPDLFSAGQKVDLQPKAIAAYRNNARVYRS